MRSKGLQEFLQEDKSLLKEITYEEYIKKEIVPQNSDCEIQDAYEAYQELVEALQEK